MDCIHVSQCTYGLDLPVKLADQVLVIGQSHGEALEDTEPSKRQEFRPKRWPQASVPNLFDNAELFRYRIASSPFPQGIEEPSISGTNYDLGSIETVAGWANLHGHSPGQALQPATSDQHANQRQQELVVELSFYQFTAPISTPIQSQHVEGFRVDCS